MLDTSGFGAAEVISLKVGDIGSKRMLIRVTLVLPIAIGRLSSSPLRPLPKEAFNERRQQTASAEIPIACDAPPRPPPAVSSVGGLRTPAPECVVPSSWAGIPKSSHQRKSMHHQRYL